MNGNRNSAARVVATIALTALCLVAVFGDVSSAYAGPNDDRDEATRLYKQGRLDPALAKVNSFLAAQPKDPQGRFVKGLILTEQKKTQDAIQVFTALTEDFPELPEPYNNLAVLYASLGNYDKARAALELAIHTHPSYATAHENLGDIYAQLARRSYDKALQLDKNNTAAQTKLSMVKDLFSTAKPSPATTAAATQVASTSKVDTKAAKAELAKAEPSKPDAAKPEPAKPAAATVAMAATKAAPPVAAAQPASAAEAAIKESLEAWSKAWSDKRVDAYLAAYAPSFEPPDKLSRKAWEQQRRERIERPKSIEVGIKISSIKVDGDKAVAVFRQSYRSDALKTNSTKTMRLVKSGDKWLIQQERSG